MQHKGFFRRRSLSRVIHNSAYKICSGTVNDGLLSTKLWNLCFTAEIRCFWFQYSVAVYLPFVLFRHTACPLPVTFLRLRKHNVLSSDKLKPKPIPSRKSKHYLKCLSCLLTVTQLMQALQLFFMVNLKSILP